MKIIFLDADGTLLHHSGIIPESAVKAIKMAKEKGHKICLCTGRQHCELYGDLLNIDFDGIITGSGNGVYINNNLLHESYFDLKSIQRLVQFFKENRIPVLCETDHKIYGNQEAYDYVLNLKKIHCDSLSLEEQKKHGVMIIYKNLNVCDYDTLLKKKINKVTFFDSNLTYNQIKEELQNEFDLVPSTFALLGKESGEISQKGITKGTGMKYLMDHYHMSKKDVLSIGDSYNDLPMFEESNICIAMGNADEYIKSVCDYTTTPILEDGIYHAFLHFNLI